MAACLPSAIHATQSRCRARALATLCLFALAGSASAQTAPQRPFPQHVSYAEGSLRPSHRTQAEQDGDVRALYDAWKARYLAPAGSEPDGHPRYRVRTGRDPGDPTVSEAQGYGLIIAALLAGHDPGAQTIFDGLLEFTRDHPSAIDDRLMDWKVEADEVPDPSGNDSAFDGDADIAYALLLAAEQWGVGGRFDYALEARRVTAGLEASVVGHTSNLPLLGDWVDPNGPTFSQWTPRTSDLLTDHFRAFEHATGQSVWAALRTTAQSTIEHVQAAYAPATGLVPDFLEPTSPGGPLLRPASPGFLEGPNDGAYYYNATRVPLRLGVDALLHDDPVSRAQVQRISLFVEGATGGDPAALCSGYALDGTPLPGSCYFSTAFGAPLGVAAMLTPSQQAWLDALYEAVRSSDESYYEDTLSLLGLLVLSGNYWGPGAAPTEAVPSLSGHALALVVASLGILGGHVATRPPDL